jgi:hypothetical protein
MEKYAMASSGIDPDALAHDEVLAALASYENGEGDAEHPVVRRVTERIAHYSALAGEALGRGRDYLPLLTPAEGTSAVDIIAMELVLEIMEAELASAE